MYLQNIRFLPVVLSTLLLVTGCNISLFRQLSVRTDYVTRSDLASLHVNTPDPRKSCPPLGQRLTISWDLDRATMRRYQRLFLSARVILHNHEEVAFSIPITCNCGSYVYSLLNEEYFSKNGILTYKVELWGDDTLLDLWQHQIWTEIVL